MEKKTGNVSIHAQNIMPVIKKWLYSDKDIFVREMVSNACDAVTKMRIAGGEDDYQVHVEVDAAAKQLRFIDNGIGMTADEVERYIGQVAFSGAEEFLKQYDDKEKDGGIIGHFGLGFYSAFMVASKVTIDTLSYQPGAQAVRWESEDGMTYTLSDSDWDRRGTRITLDIAPEEEEFLRPFRVREVLERYCAFMQTPIFLDEIKPEGAKDDGPKADEAKETAAPVPVNDTHPLWLKNPSDCTEEEYKAFYRKVFREFEEPLFWVHLNVDYPFNLKGILYFPKLRQDFGGMEGQIKLFSGQVFVADNIKEVIPEFLMLLKGVIDCPDLPLNVSRSFLQNDGYVKKMAAYITRKVADRLVSEFNTHREDYEKYWRDIHPFVKYGCIRDEKFFDRVKEAILFEKTSGGFTTLKELEDKGETVYYTSDAKRQAHLIAQYTSQDKDVIVLDTLIDNNFISFLEFSGKEQNLKFQRVDASTEGLTEEGETDETARASLEEKFRKALDDKELEVKLTRFKSDDLPATITVDEQSRRFTDMSRQWGGGFQMPEHRTLTLNEKHPLVKYLISAEEEGDITQMVCRQIVDLCEMARQPLVADRMVDFLNRSNKLLTMLAEK